MTMIVEEASKLHITSDLADYPRDIADGINKTVDDQLCVAMC